MYQIARKTPIPTLTSRKSRLDVNEYIAEKCFLYIFTGNNPILECTEQTFLRAVAICLGNFRSELPDNFSINPTYENQFSLSIQACYKELKL